MTDSMKIADQPCAEDHYPVSSAEGSYSGEVQICNRKGLHARASAMFVKSAATFDAEIFVSRCGETVGGTSIMGLMMLAASQGTKIHIETRGAEAEQAFKALTELVMAGFHEED